jgi:MFS family permease
LQVADRYSSLTWLSSLHCKYQLLSLPTWQASSFSAHCPAFLAAWGVANGGGSVSDLFEASERATVLGCYLLGPLLGSTLGPLLGGIIVSYLQWRWMFWIMAILAAATLLASYLLLHETYAPIILQKRKAKLETQNSDTRYKVNGASNQSTTSKIVTNSSRAARILFTQPIVLAMSLYGALVFSSMYTLYATFQDVWSQHPYYFSSTQISLTSLAPAIGFLLAAALIVPFIDKLYIYLAARSKDGKGVPEYRLPLANIGAVLLPVSLFWFGWTLEYRLPWPVPLSATLLFGAAQVSIFNTLQNYYIDSFEQYSASALAAGAFLRAILGGIVPLFAPTMFEKLGYGWGMSVFGFLSLVLMPAPMVFWFYGGRLRERFTVEF